MRVLFTLLLLIPLHVFAQGELIQTEILNGKVRLSVPKEFEPMSPEMWKVKYRRPRMPLLILSDKDAEVNLLIDTSKQSLSDGQIADYKNFQIKQMKSARSDMEVLDEGIKEVNGRKIGFFKFLASAMDQKIFNYYFFFSVNGKLVMCTFNCIERFRKSWEPTADSIAQSIEIK